MSDESKKLIESTSPEIEGRRHDWNQYALAYLGGEAYAASALVQHTRESEAEFKNRKTQVDSIEFCRSITQERSAYLFRDKVAPDIPPAASIIENYYDDIDMRGNSLTKFLDKVERNAMVYGSGLILVDATKPSRVYRSMREQQDDGSRPYMTSYTPLDVQNFVEYRFGALRWILFRDGAGPAEISGEGAAMTVSPSVKNTGFTYWDRMQWIRFNNDGVITESGVHNLGVVPVVNVQFLDVDGWYFGLSLLRDVEPENRRLINRWSLLNEIFQKQTFGQLVAPGDGKDANGNPIEVGTSSVLWFSGDTAPSFIQPDASNADILIKGIAETIKNIEREAELQGGIVRDNGQIASGVALAQLFMPTNMALVRQATLAGPSFAQALWLMAKMSGKNAPVTKFSVSFPPDFGVVTTGTLIEEYAKLTAGINPPAPTLIEEYEVRIMNSLGRDLPPAELEARIAKIKSELTGDHQALPPPIEGPADGVEVETQTIEGANDENDRT